jgi:hypothetical protein
MNKNDDMNTSQVLQSAIMIIFLWLLIFMSQIKRLPHRHSSWIFSEEIY